MRKVISVVALGLAIALAGCNGTTNTTTPATSGVSAPPSPTETLLWSSAPQRPDWTMNEPDTVNGIMTFVGLSDRHKSEKASREDARRNASGAVVKYMGTLVKDKWERAATSFGLEGDVIDATAATNAFQKQMAVNMANNVKTKSWYIEKWQTPTGVGHLVFVLAQVPEKAIDESYKKTARTMAKAAEQKAKAANDDIAKNQAAKAAEFWKQMQERGVTE